MLEKVWNKKRKFAVPYFCTTGGFSQAGLRVLRVLGNANNGANAGSCYLNGNNGVGASNANYPAVLKDT